MNGSQRTPALSGHVRAHAPVVLHVGADVVVIVVVVDRIALQEPAAERAHHEVGERQARALPVERERAVGRAVVQRLDLGVDPVAAKRDLMVALHQIDVVGQLPAIRIEVARDWCRRCRRRSRCR